ncbi:urease accessory protein UreD [Symbioplanes lichenis]|uniref:urease accessory protein UreD n=1 Tax=Symbioplanes lichenis TaxID=1629072 RepID=UPI00273A05A6|nr:urease accessory protein UreD [Actinoplanes lichenis]
MRSRARLVAEEDGRGGTRPAVLHGESPLLLRRTGPRGGDLTVHLVGGAAGPLRGDDLRLDIEVGPGAHLTVHSVAAQLALPGRPGLPPSRYEIHATVAAGATLRWTPEPLIAAAGCDHHTRTVVDVAEGGTLLWRDDLVCGRHHEPSGAVLSDTTVRYAGRTLYRHELHVGPSAPAWSAAAILGGAQALGTIVLAGPALPEPRLLPGEAALMPLAGPGLLATAVGPDIRAVRRALDPLSEGQYSLRPV